MAHDPPINEIDRGSSWIASRSTRLSPAGERRQGERNKTRLGTSVAAVAGLLVTPLLWTAIWPFLDALFVGAAPLAEPLTENVVAAETATTAPLPRIVSTIPVISGETAGPAGTASSVAVVGTPEASATAPVERAPAVASMPEMVSTAAATPAPTAPPTRVPTAVATAVILAPATPAPLPPVQSAAVPAQMYVVQRGDTLYSIARRHGTTVDSLVTLNGLGSKDTVLRVGFQLVLPR